MNLASIKVELAKFILNTEDVDLINQVKALFEMRYENWLNELPEEIRNSLEKGLKQSRYGQTLSHAEVMAKYSQWEKK